ncbi:SLX4 [Acrasis kona]|uniref:SLX4 n=1 Tax=Acrasis kona TaxID=1008807 RepID=A0AAW2Z7Z7_9EUKA
MSEQHNTGRRASADLYLQTSKEVLFSEPQNSPSDKIVRQDTPFPNHQKEAGPIVNLPSIKKFEQDRESAHRYSASTVTETDSTMEREILSSTSSVSVSDSVFEMQDELQRQREISKQTIEDLYRSNTSLITTNQSTIIQSASSEEKLNCLNGTDLLMSGNDETKWIFDSFGAIQLYTTEADKSMLLSSEVPPFMIGSGITERFRVMVMEIEPESEDSSVCQRWLVQEVGDENKNRIIICAANSEYVLARDADNLILERRLGNASEERYLWSIKH